MVVRIVVTEDETLFSVSRIPIYNPDPLLARDFTDQTLRHVNAVVEARAGEAMSTQQPSGNECCKQGSFKVTAQDWLGLRLARQIPLGEEPERAG
jgi:hypothetical protein